jgi:hypothetical protein
LQYFHFIWYIGIFVRKQYCNISKAPLHCHGILFKLCRYVCLVASVKKPICFLAPLCHLAAELF